MIGVDWLWSANFWYGMPRKYLLPSYSIQWKPDVDTGVYLLKLTHEYI